MSEEDTYNALRRIPYMEMTKLAFSIPSDEWCLMPDSKLDEFFRIHGWTYRAWINAHD